MRAIKIYLFNFLLIFSVCVQAETKTENIKPSDIIKTMQGDGHILMIRHAMAPGFGDPDNIKIGDCSTQRNLDESGRKQSRRIGTWLKNNNIKPSAIYSSQWCRCLETATLLDLGEVQELKGLNSFFQMTENRESSLGALNKFISAQKTDNKLIIMVTHSVTISAISGQSVASGDGVLLKLNKETPYEFVNVVNTDLTNNK